MAAESIDIAMEDAQLLASMENDETLQSAEGQPGEEGSTHNTQHEEEVHAADVSSIPPPADDTTKSLLEETSELEVPVVARRPAVGRKRAITAALATPKAQLEGDEREAPPASGNAAADAQASAPKVPAKKASATDQDVLQAILGTQGDAQGSDTSKASKQSSSNKKAAGKAKKAGSGKENGTPTATKKGKDTADKKPRKKSEKPRKQSAYNMFCAAQRPVLKGEKPDLSMTDVTKELAALWGAKTVEEKKVYQDEADAATAKQLEEFEAGGLKDQKKSSNTAGAKGKAKPKAGKKQSKKSQELKDAEESEDLPEHAAEAEESGDDSDRENCDWEKYPVEAILGTTTHNKFIVKRKGANLCEYGLVDASAVKRQRLDPDIKAPVSLQQLEEFEEWESKFKAAVRENTDRGALELDNLSKDTPLETCYYLGKMLEKNYPLAKPKRNVDPGRPFPVVALSMVSQRLLDLEKAKVLSLEQRLAERQEE